MIDLIRMGPDLKACLRHGTPPSVKDIAALA
ncbi:MAG: hypothetical protein QOF84_5029 [Streptomyces sp.]|jgi:hypothetical protein|nr:hypothetical protein [Streptomyces sp.]